MSAYEKLEVDAQNLSENAIDLIRSIVLKYTRSLLDEMHSQITERNKRIAELEAVGTKAEEYFNSIDCGMAEKEAVAALAAAGYFKEDGK